MAGAPGSMGKLMRFSFAPTGRGSPEVIGGRFKPAWCGRRNYAWPCTVRLKDDGLVLMGFVARYQPQLVRPRRIQCKPFFFLLFRMICMRVFLEYPVSTCTRTCMIGNGTHHSPQALVPAVDGAVRLAPHAGRVSAPSVGAPLAPRPRVGEALAAEPALGLLEHRVDPARRLRAHGPGKLLDHLGRLAPHRALARPAQLVARQASPCAASGVPRLVVKLADQLVLAETDGLDVAAHGFRRRRVGGRWAAERSTRNCWRAPSFSSLYMWPVVAQSQ